MNTSSSSGKSFNKEVLNSAIELLSDDELPVIEKSDLK
jgi:hypothetical protein